jgi:hypothetical protein
MFPVDRPFANMPRVVELQLHIYSSAESKDPNESALPAEDGSTYWMVDKYDPLLFTPPAKSVLVWLPHAVIADRVGLTSPKSTKFPREA